VARFVEENGGEGALIVDCLTYTQTNKEMGGWIVKKDKK
jgi:hypothetical protein